MKKTISLKCFDFNTGTESSIEEKKRFLNRRWFISERQDRNGKFVKNLTMINLRRNFLQLGRELKGKFLSYF